MDVQPFLQSGESLLWSGRPRRGVRLQAGDMVMIPFSMMWGGFAIFWEYMVLHSHAPRVMILFGLPFVAIGLFMMIGRFFFDAARRAKTLYAVTSNRVMIVNGRNVSSYPLKQIPGVTTTEGADGFGNVILVSATPQFAQLTQFGTMFATASRAGAAPVLEMIESPRLVADTITRAQQAV